MKRKKPVKSGKYIIVCLLLLLTMLLAGCTNGNPAGSIDPNAVEHNPNQQVNQSSGDKQGGSMTGGNGQSELSETVSGELSGTVGEDGNNGNGVNEGSTGSDGNSGTNESTNKTDAEKNPGVAGNTENVDNVGAAQPVETEYTVVLDPGHGGKFTGAMYDQVEKDVVLKIANYAKAYLEEHYPQLEVKMTREEDKDFDSELAKDLENRVQLGKEMGADVFVSFHLNASAAHNIRGAEVLCPHRENVKTDSFLLANCILDELAALGIKRRGIVTKNSNDTVDANGNPVEYYAINRHAANRDMVGIIVEHCFMDHEEDKLFIADDEALRRLGEADARGIAAYFGY